MRRPPTETRSPSSFLTVRSRWAAGAALALLVGCAGEVGGGGGNTGSGAAPAGTGGVGGPTGTGGGVTGSGATPGSGGGIVGPGSGGTITGSSGGSSGGLSAACMQPMLRPGRAPLRRLTSFEYNNTVRDLLGDTTQPAQAFPSESLGNGFGNDGDAQPSSESLLNAYSTVGEAVALRATATPALMAKLAPCAMNVTAANEETCARTIIDNLLPKAYRRPLVAAEAMDLLTTIYRPARTAATFPVAVATVIETVLQSPDFLYKIELGVADPANASRRRPTTDEMATRLSYLYLGTLPSVDPTLTAAARTNELLTNEGVRAQATRLRDLTASRTIVRYFFDNLLPISALTKLERSKTDFPTYTATIGSYMREETQKFLENEIYVNNGSWQSVLTAPYTMVNLPLAMYYGLPTTGLNATDYKMVALDTTKRLGLLTQGGVMAGTIHSNLTNPVVRGSFVVQKLLCRTIPAPTGAIAEMVKPPDPDATKTARQRYSAHSENAVCGGCHKYMDPVGFAFENYDPVGLYRTQENGININASGGVPNPDGTLGTPTAGPIELVRELAKTDDMHSCFAGTWLNYAYGQTLRTSGQTADPQDVCIKELFADTFKKSGYNVKQMLVDLTQTDAFLYLPAR